MQENALSERTNASQPGGLDPRIQDERLWATLCHLSSLAFLAGIPFGHIFGPLVVWLLKRNESSFVDEQGSESLNFQVSMTIYIFFFLVFGMGIGILLAASSGEYYIGVPILLCGIFAFPVILLLDFILVIVASIKANHGENFRYPLTIRLF